MKLNLCRDPALVSSWCWRLRTRRSEWFLWRSKWRIRMQRIDAEPDMKESESPK